MAEQTYINDFPELVNEWDWQKNANLGLEPSMMRRGSNKAVYWVCSKGHSWKDTIAHRIAGRNCPYCSNHRLLVGYNDLATRNPTLAAEWHPIQNADLTPKDVFVSSNIKVWWLCQQGHSWIDTVNHRHSGRNCPYCSGKRILEGFNDLGTLNPQLAAEWHPSLNGEMTPQNTSANSSKKVWWKCALGHEWKAVVSSRNRGNGCPICGKELKTSFPEQAVYFYIKKLFPDSINRYIECGYELDIYIPSIQIGIEYDGMRFHTHASTKKECRKDAFFASKKISVIRIKETSDLINSISIKNNIIYYSPLGNYRFLSDVIHNLIELICSKRKIIAQAFEITLTQDRSLIFHSYLSDLKEKSIISNPALARDWNYLKNGDLNPEYITLNSGKKVWWICEKGHEWQAVVASRNSGCSCPYCSNQKVLDGYNDLATKRPDLSLEWHPTKNGNLVPCNVLPGTAKKVWWICQKGHEWQSSVNDRTQGNGCPFCSNKKVKVGENDLATRNPKLASEWHPTKNGDLTPEMFASGSGKKVWWLCESGHEWQASIYQRNKGAGCPKCYFERLRLENGKSR